MFSVILKSYDWQGAFDRLDPTKVTIKCINIGIRSSVVKILIDFLNERKMEVKMNQKTSSSYDLIGGGPQGSLIGQVLYIIGSDDAAEDVPEEDKFKYVDDLISLDSLNVRENLTKYDVHNHVPSDIAIGERFLAQDAFKSQSYNDSIAMWTSDNKMKIHEKKSKYMVFSNMKEKFSTRLTLNNQVLERAKEMVHLGIVITEDMSWDRNITEICKKAYPRVKMLTKLKFVGVRTEELIELYCLYIRSLTEYCSSAFHSSLSNRLSNKLENIQEIGLRVILNVMYVSYEAALEMCGLEALYVRSEHRSLEFVSDMKQTKICFHLILQQILIYLETGKSLK